MEDEATMAALGMLGQPPATVQCQACGVEIDQATGVPVEPVTDEAVARVREYMTEAGQTELGGVALPVGPGGG